jgi:hypothetical protein
MDIVLIYWKIKPDQEKRFLDFWENKLKIKDKSGLVAEYLSRVNDPKTDRDRKWFRWNLFRRDVVTYINVGLWKSKEEFLAETERYRSDDSEFRHEVAEIRAEDTERAWLTASLARLGTYKITPEELKIVS